MPPTDKSPSLDGRIQRLGRGANILIDYLDQMSGALNPDVHEGKAFRKFWKSAKHEMRASDAARVAEIEQARQEGYQAGYDSGYECYADKMREEGKLY